MKSVAARRGLGCDAQTCEVLARDVSGFKPTFNASGSGLLKKVVCFECTMMLRARTVFIPSVVDLGLVAEIRSHLRWLSTRMHLPVACCFIIVIMIRLLRCAAGVAWCS